MIEKAPTSVAHSGSRRIAPRVAFIYSTGTLGGGELYGTTLMTALDHARYRPILLCPPVGDLVALARERGLAVARLDLPDQVARTARASFSFDPRTLAPVVRGAAISMGRTARELRRSGARVAHICAMKAGLFAAPAAYALGIPVVWDFKDIVSDEHYSPALRRVVVGYLNLFAACVIANSGAIREELIRAGVDGEKVVALHNGIDLQRFSPRVAQGQRARLRAELGIAPEAPTAVMVGRLAPWKGHEVFIRAAALVHREMPTARFLILGDSAFDPPVFRAQLEQLVADLDLDGTLRFLGFRDDVPEVMCASDLVVHCSTLPEPLGLTPIEAMALGRPVIAAAAGGPLETVAPGKTGLLTAPGDHRELAAAMRRLLADPEARARMGAAGRERAEAMFDLRHNARAVMQIYDRVRASAPGRSAIP
jgi:glycosyltransferase involved in cell wall biosynthesis